MKPAYSKGIDHPDWRWRRVDELMKQPPTAKRKAKPGRRTVQDTDQILLERAVAYMRVYNAAEGTNPEDAHWRRIMADWADLWEAHAIYTGTSDALINCKYIIEAMIVAGEPAEAIAAYTAYNLPTILNYEVYFFDIRNRPAGWLTSHVMHGVARGSVAKDDPNFGWKAVAQAGGMGALRAVWEGHSEKEINQLFQDRGNMQGQINYFYAQSGRTIRTSSDQRFVCEAAQETRKVDIAAHQAGVHAGSSLDAAKKLVSGLKLMVGQFNTLVLADEPRVSDLLSLRLEAVKIKPVAQLAAPQPKPPSDQEQT